MSGHTEWQAAVWRQFGAAIEMLEHAIRACPDSLWAEAGRGAEFWRLAYHTVFWLDYYLSDDPDAYRLPAPFTLDERDPAVVALRVHTPAELLENLARGRARCRARLTAMTAEAAGEPSAVPRLGLTAGELVLYNLRHVQHGAAQLNLLLRQATGEPAPAWVRRSLDAL